LAILSSDSLKKELEEKRRILELILNPSPINNNRASILGVPNKDNIPSSIKRTSLNLNKKNQEINNDYNGDNLKSIYYYIL
jgi:hypothetical protein